MAKLFIQQPEGDQLLTELEGSQVYLIGRSEDCTICIPDDSISKHHAKLAFVGQGWTIADLGSSNGTSVNGQALTQPLNLSDSAQIMLGEQIVLLFVNEGAAEPLGAPARDNATCNLG